MATAWPLLLLALVVALGAGRVAGDGAGDAQPSRPEPAPGQALQLRRFGPARLAVPTDWVTLDRSPSHVTWGDARRTHTVTLAHTEASVLPLPGVVQSMVEQSRGALPGARLVGAPRVLQLPEDAPHDDAAMLARFRVEGQGAPRIDVAQAWRRDSRAALDLVATWTSSDGEWPVPPRSGIPLGEASR